MELIFDIRLIKGSTVLYMVCNTSQHYRKALAKRQHPTPQIMLSAKVFFLEWVSEIDEFQRVQRNRAFEREHRMQQYN